MWRHCLVVQKLSLICTKINKRMAIKKVVSFNAEEDQLQALELIMLHSGNDNPQVHMRQALRQYCARETDKIPASEMQGLKVRLAKSRK